MTRPLSRRDLLKLASGSCMAAWPLAASQAEVVPPPTPCGWVRGCLTGAQALVETLIQEGTDCVFGIPGAQLNEVWDTMKTRGLAYLLVTHEFSASTMADGCARSTGKVGVLCVIPGPGLTNALSGIGEALLDSIPLVVIVGDVAQGQRYRAFQVHELPQVPILQSVTKGVFPVTQAIEIPQAIRQAFQLARAGEPGPTGVVVPYPLLIEKATYNSGPLPPLPPPYDEAACAQAVHLLNNVRCQVGIYAGQGCMNHSPALVRLAENLQAPVATSISGKGAMPEQHPLSVGWGFGPQGTCTAEAIFKKVDLVLAIGVRFSEVSTGFYAIPQPPRLIHVDINPNNLGRNYRTDVAVNAEAGLFLGYCLSQADQLRRPPNHRLVDDIRQHKARERRCHEEIYARCGADPMAFLLAMRRLSCPEALLFVDVTASEYWATETFTTFQPRTFFNPTNNQAMGWSIPAALGAQRVHPGRLVLTVTGDGCFLMSGMEISTAVREQLPVKFFVLDDQAYHYMQALQEPAYLQTTATILARLDYRALAQGWGIGYREILCTADVEPVIRASLAQPGPVLTRVAIDYRRRPIRWIDATKKRFTKELTAGQAMRFLARIGSRAVDLRPPLND